LKAPTINAMKTPDYILKAFIVILPLERTIIMKSWIATKSTRKTNVAHLRAFSHLGA
jgi:hypothetical protein